MKVGKYYYTSDGLEVLYLGEYAGKGVFLRSSPYHPFVTWYYDLLEGYKISLYGGNYYTSLEELYS